MELKLFGIWVLLKTQIIQRICVERLTQCSMYVNTL